MSCRVMFMVIYCLPKPMVWSVPSQESTRNVPGLTHMVTPIWRPWVHFNIYTIHSGMKPSYLYPLPRRRIYIEKAPVLFLHYNDVIMGLITSQITSLTIVYSTVYSGADQRNYQSSASLAFVRGIHRGPVNSPHKWPVTRKMFPFDDVIMTLL